MKLYYYTYETTVLRPFFDTEYDLYEGFLIDSPLGLVRLDDEEESYMYGSIDEFKTRVSKYFPRNFDIVELK